MDVDWHAVLREVAQTYLLKRDVVLAFSASAAVLVVVALVLSWLLRYGAFRSLCLMAAGGGMAAVIALTLGRPGVFGQRNYAGCDQSWQEFLVREAEPALNLLLFIPMAFFGVLATRRPILVVVACGLLSMSVEWYQSATNIGFCQVADVQRNVAGAVAGAAAASALLVVWFAGVWVTRGSRRTA